MREQRGKSDGRANGSGGKSKAPVFLVRPASKAVGLDYLHIALIILVIILVGLAIALSRFSSVKLVNCQYGIVNGSCVTESYNSTQAIMAARRIMASYSTVNTSLSLLPFYTLVNSYRATYLPQDGKWLVYTPYNDPYTGANVSMYLVLNKNLTLNTSVMQTLSPIRETENYVVAPGVISLSGKSESVSEAPIPVNLILDVYAKGALSAIQSAINASIRYKGRVNVSYDFIFTNASVSKYAEYGKGNTQILASYIFCASKQPEFAGFITNLSKVFDGNPIDIPELNAISNGTGINYTYMQSCISNSSKPLYYQSLFAQLYNVTSTPEFIVNGKYQTISTRLDQAINYSLSNLNSK